MRWIKYTLIALPILIVLAFLHYTLPGRDVVRIVDTENRRVPISGISAIFWNTSEPTEANSQTRDVKFISAIRPSGRADVYRNEDTGWGWPPYFKFDSATLQARASDLISSKDSPRWVAIRSYGWRIELLSVYPNALGVQEVAGPDARLIPWTAILSLIVLLIAGFWMWRVVSRFFRNRVDPVVAEVAQAFDTADDRFDQGRAQARTRWQSLREWWVERFQ